MALKVNYKDDQLNVSQNTNRVFDLVDQNGQVVLSNLSLQDKTVYSQTGDNFGAADINATNTAVNKNTKNVSWYGTCSTAAATTAKVATTSDTAFALATGAKVKIKFTNANTASAPTLNVDSKGAKAIKAYGTTAPTSWWKAGDIVEFTYDGTNWIMGATQGEIEQINTNLTAQDNLKFRFATDGEGNYGFLKADDSFSPFKSGYKYIGGVVGVRWGIDPNTNQMSIKGSRAISFDCKNNDYRMIDWTYTTYGATSTIVNNDYATITCNTNSYTITPKVDCVRLNSDGTTSNVTAGTAIQTNYSTINSASGVAVLAFE